MTSVAAISFTMDVILSMLHALCLFVFAVLRAPFRLGFAPNF